MEEIIYYSKNAKKPPHVVTIRIDGGLTYINCDCPLGVDKKICRHKINAIRGDKGKSDEFTSYEAISRLRTLFNQSSTLRAHLEHEWRELSGFINTHKEEVEEIERRRKVLGEAFADGFRNEVSNAYGGVFNKDGWEGLTETYARELSCKVHIRYKDYDESVSDRAVLVDEVLVNNSAFYLQGHCYLRGEQRTFRVDRIQAIEISDGPNKNLLLHILRGQGLF